MLPYSSLFSITSGFQNVSEDYSSIPHFQKVLKRFLKVIDCTLQLQVSENVVGFEKALGAVKVIKDQTQYRSQSLLNLARGYFSWQNGHNFCIDDVIIMKFG